MSSPDLLTPMVEGLCKERRIVIRVVDPDDRRDDARVEGSFSAICYHGIIADVIRGLDVYVVRPLGFSVQLSGHRQVSSRTVQMEQTSFISTCKISIIIYVLYNTFYSRGLLFSRKIRENIETWNKVLANKL